MWNRWSLLMVILGALGGYAVASPSVTAQSEALPFAVGETVTLWYREGTSTFGASVECTVAEIRGSYVKCTARSRIAGSDRAERWLTLKYVVQITKRQD